MSSLIKLQAAAERAGKDLIHRESLVELVLLCAVVKEHLLVIGPPGTAKSQAVRNITRELGGKYFEYLVGRFTEPSEVFGPVNLQKLKMGIVESETKGMLPEADIAFLDEIFKGSTAILNTLLSILNERTFRRGSTNIKCPLRVCVAASNQLPEDERLAAFADRFLVRSFVSPIGDAGLEELLEIGWSQHSKNESSASLLSDLDALSKKAFAMDMTQLRPSLAHTIRALRGAGIDLSDRRIVRMQRLVAGAAALAGRESPSKADLWPVIYALPTEQAQNLGREILKDLLCESQSDALKHAAAEGSLGAKAKAGLILKSGQALLAEFDAADNRETFSLRFEAVAREIDATFSKETLPEPIAELRATITKHLRGSTRD